MNLTQPEAALLVDTIDQAIEGHKESKQHIEIDPSIKSEEELVDMMNMIDNNIDTLEGIRKKVKKRW